MKKLKFKIAVWKEQLRRLIIIHIFNEDEKYLIAIAMDDRIDQLEKICARERWADTFEISKDVSDYNIMRPLFSTKNWN